MYPPSRGALSPLAAQKSDWRRAAAPHAARSGFACAPPVNRAHPRDDVRSLGRDGDEESPRCRPGCHLAKKRFQRTQFLGTNAVPFRSPGGPPLPQRNRGTLVTAYFWVAADKTRPRVKQNLRPNAALLSNSIHCAWYPGVLAPKNSCYAAASVRRERRGSGA